MYAPLNKYLGRSETFLRLPVNLIERLYRRGTEPLAGYLAQYRWITPNRLSFAGFLVGGVGAAICILTLPLWTAGVLLALGELLDNLDGDVARKQGTVSREGAIADAVLDRYTDFLVIGALTYLTTVLLDGYADFLIGGSPYLTTGTVMLLGLAALLGSTQTPYVRAKTEAVGKVSVPTIGNRDMRDGILVLGLLLSQPVWTLGAIALIANFSAVHRLIMALRKD